jgi:hypothetical protein
MTSINIDSQDISNLSDEDFNELKELVESEEMVRNG